MGVAAVFNEPLPGISPGVYGPDDFQEVAAIVHEAAGIVLPDGKAMLVYSRLAPLVREAGCGTFANYIALMRVDAGHKGRAVAALTTNHTYFYRESHHFEHFAQTVRPGILNRLEHGEAVRLWSAGCSSGEETWSLVLTLLGSEPAEGRRIAGRDLRLLASDIAPHALKKAIAATYPAGDLEPVPSELVRPWTRQAGDTIAIADTARDLVRFRSLNLLGDWPISGRFATIFCRNVMIYFDQPTKERLVARFAEVLEPGGHLYIGHSERVTGPAAPLLDVVGPTIYRRKSR